MVKPQWWLNREEDIEKINAFPEWEDSFDQCPELVECSSCGNFFPEEEICKTCNSHIGETLKLSGYSKQCCKCLEET